MRLLIFLFLVFLYSCTSPNKVFDFNKSFIHYSKVKITVNSNIDFKGFINLNKTDSTICSTLYGPLGIKVGSIFVTNKLYYTDFYNNANSDQGFKLISKFLKLNFSKTELINILTFNDSLFLSNFLNSNKQLVTKTHNKKFHYANFTFVDSSNNKFLISIDNRKFPYVISLTYISREKRNQVIFKFYEITDDKINCKLDN